MIHSDFAVKPFNVTSPSGEAIALDLMEKLGMDKSDLVEGAYAGLLSKIAVPVAP